MERPHLRLHLTHAELEAASLIIHMQDRLVRSRVSKCGAWIESVGMGTITGMKKKGKEKRWK